MTPEEIRTLREKLGLTQAQLASKLEVAVTTVSRWENGTPMYRANERELLRLKKKAGI